MSDYYPLRRIENFDYPNGTRFWDAYDQDFLADQLPGTGSGPFQKRLQRYGAPLETNGAGQAVVGRGPYIPGTYDVTWDEENHLSLFTGYGQGLTTGIALNNFDSDDGEGGLFLVYHERDEFYEVRLSAGSPGPHGIGILRPSTIASIPVQICWSQADGVWAEIVYYFIEDIEDPLSVAEYRKRTIPLAPPSSDARTVGLRARTHPSIPGSVLWDFSINGTIVAESIDYNGLPTGLTGTLPTVVVGDERLLYCLLVVNPVPESALEPWGGRAKDYYARSWGGSPEFFESAPESTIDYYYPGERYPVFDWIYTWHDFTLYDGAGRRVAPPLHQTRGDFLAPGGAYKYRTARTRQSSIWQNAHL